MAAVAAMKKNTNPTVWREPYYAPNTNTIVVQYDRSLLIVSGGDDNDNTGGTGHNMPWDD